MSAARSREQGEREGRVVGLDYGRKRIGVAVSDPDRVLATPHSVVENDAPPARPPDGLVRIIESIGPARIVVGVPLEMDGTPGEMAREVREFGRRLAARTGLPVEEWDERLSTVRASRILLEAEPRRRRRRRKGRLDRTAAAVILRTWLGGSGGGRALEPLEEGGGESVSPEESASPEEGRT